MSDPQADRLVVEEVADGRVRVALRRAGQEFEEGAGEPVAFAPPLGEAEREDLRWYLEDYLQAPYAVYEQRGQAVQARLAEWGRALFAAVFGLGTPGQAAYLKAREGRAELALISRSPSFLSLPWELLQDPQRPTPLALELGALDRTLQVAGAAVAVPPGEELRVLMVIARPAGLGDVGYQMIARPLLERLEAVRGRVDLDVLRPPTFEVLDAQLKAAREAGRPYHILHFDGHGTFGGQGLGGGGQHQFEAGARARGYLVFEAEGGGDQLVAAEQFALAVSQGQVPLVVLERLPVGDAGRGGGCRGGGGDPAAGGGSRLGGGDGLLGLCGGGGRVHGRVLRGAVRRPGRLGGGGGGAAAAVSGEEAAEPEGPAGARGLDGAGALPAPPHPLSAAEDHPGPWHAVARCAARRAAPGRGRSGAAEAPAQDPLGGRPAVRRAGCRLLHPRAGAAVAAGGAGARPGRAPARPSWPRRSGAGGR